MSFTFKKHTGWSSVGNPPDTDIKCNKKIVGCITAYAVFNIEDVGVGFHDSSSYYEAPRWISRDFVWKVQFMQKDGHWITVKQQFDNEPQAREWVKANAERILKLGLYQGITR
jgi:hypothetical protein